MTSTGIRHDYPRIPLPQKLKAYIALCRPFTLVAPLVGGVTVPLVYLGHAGSLADFWSHAFAVLYAAITLVLCNCASNVWNQATDADIDRINKPYRPVPRNLVTAEEARAIAMLLCMAAVLRATMTSAWFGAFVFAIMGISVLYSEEPLRFKKRLWLSNVAVAVPRGVLGYVALWCVLGDPFDPLPWLIGSIITLYLIGATTAKDIPDVEGDARYGMRTLPVVYGVRRAAAYSTAFMVASGVLFVAAIATGAVRRSAASVALAVVGVLWMAAIVWMLLRDEENAVLENNRAWAAMYALLLTLQLGFCIVYVI